MVALLFYALYRRHYVRFGFKILGATFFLEASDPQIKPKNSSDVGRISPELTWIPSNTEPTDFDQRRTLNVLRADAYNKSVNNGPRSASITRVERSRTLQVPPCGARMLLEWRYHVNVNKTSHVTIVLLQVLACRTRSSLSSTRCVRDSR